MHDEVIEHSEYLPLEYLHHLHVWYLRYLPMLKKAGTNCTCDRFGALFYFGYCDVVHDPIHLFPIGYRVGGDSLGVF